ncbi:MAG: DUF5627 domain-containing protein [Paludibacter sp.]
MKVTKIKTLVVLISLLGMYSCQNDPNDFPNFDYTTTYFAWQYPVRTLVLGTESYYDNSNDIKHQFVIQASMGGVYTNTKDINVGFEIDHSLVDSLSILSGTDTNRLKILPTNYYEPITSSNMIIPNGSFNGGITIKLTDAFFNDPMSYTNKYVLPVRLLSSETDSILKGKVKSTATTSLISSIATKWKIDPRIAANWDVKPMNFTVYAIKYVNQYHGYYLKRGVQKETTVGVTGTEKSYGWEKKYIEYTTYIPKLTTLSLTKLTYSDKLALSTEKFIAVVEVNSDNNVTITKDPKSTTNISGTGKYVTDIEEWGGKKRGAFYLNYTVSDPNTNKSYSVKDTLVIRDNAVAVETYIPTILPKK